MSIIAEFKKFAVKGNALDLAVGVIVGAAFGKIIDSIVNDLIMPIVSGIFGKPDFSDWFFVLGSVPDGVTHSLVELKKAGVPVLAYGSFVTVLINFFLLAIVVFGIVKLVNHFRSPAPEAPAPKTPTSEELLGEIRDILIEQKKNN